MDMTIHAEKKEVKILPPLKAQPSTYKLFVPKTVEEKIRYLIRKFPSTEWSGVLFYRHTGLFEDGTLTINCVDIFPMDLGSSSWTQFQMTEDVTAYIAENLDLFDCEMGLIHSHHTMGAFFSGQDIKTLQSEGTDTNCFVSLIVDTKGTYQAAITRKISHEELIEIRRKNPTYEFFGEGSKPAESESFVPYTATTTDKVDAIEYFMLNVEREETSNPFDYLDFRFEEIKEAKRKQAPIQGIVCSSPSTTYKSSWLPVAAKEETTSKEVSFKEWRKQQEYEEGTVFDKETMQEMIDASKWTPDPTVIHHMVAQLVTCSLIINHDINLEKWIANNMVTRYREIFNDFEEFKLWAESTVEFLANHYNESDIPDELGTDWDALVCRTAKAMADELGEYPSNIYIEEYIERLSLYNYE